MDKVLGIDSSIRFILFALLCLFGPTSGMVFGGILSSKLGGYINRKSMTFVIISVAIASGISMTIAFHKITVLFVITGWTYLFGIWAVIPPISGIIIVCLDPNLRGDGFSICNCFNNLLGSFPSSYIFSALVDAFDRKKEEEQYGYAWIITMSYNFIGLLYIIIAGVFRYKIKGDLLGESNDKNALEEENMVKSEENNDKKENNDKNEVKNVNKKVEANEDEKK